MRPDLRRVLRVKIGLTLVLWALPCLLMPAAWFRFAGLNLLGVEAVLFCRLLGAAYVALCVGYGLALRAPEKHPGMRLVGIVSNGLAAAVVWTFIFQGALAELPLRGKVYLTASAVVTTLLTGALIIARHMPVPDIPPGLRADSLPDALDDA